MVPGGRRAVLHDFAAFALAGMAASRRDAACRDRHRGDFILARRIGAVRSCRDFLLAANPHLGIVAGVVTRAAANRDVRRWQRADWQTQRNRAQAARQPRYPGPAQPPVARLPARTRAEHRAGDARQTGSGLVEFASRDERSADHRGRARRLGESNPARLQAVGCNRADQLPALPVALAPARLRNAA